MKADFKSSLEAIKQCLSELPLSYGNVELNIVRDGVGEFTVADFDIAKMSNFSVYILLFLFLFLFLFLYIFLFYLFFFLFIFFNKKR